jgi:hypothetical protein
MRIRAANGRRGAVSGLGRRVAPTYTGFCDARDSRCVSAMPRRQLRRYWQEGLEMKTRYDLALLTAAFLVWTTLHITVVAADTTGPNDPRLEMVAALQALGPHPLLGEQVGVFGRLVGADPRYFEPKFGTWPAVFLDPQIASGARFTAGAVGEDRIVLDSPDRGPEGTRWAFNTIRTDTFVFRDEASNDGGETWRLQSDYHMKRRGAAPGEQ